MTLAYTAALDFSLQKTDINAQKIYDLVLKIYGIIIASFLGQNKLRNIRFFEETFLLTNTSIKMVLEMLMFTFFDTDIGFAKKKLIWRSSITAKTLLTIKRVEFID